MAIERGKLRRKKERRSSCRLSLMNQRFDPGEEEEESAVFRTLERSTSEDKNVMFLPVVNML